LPGLILSASFCGALSAAAEKNHDSFYHSLNCQSLEYSYKIMMIDKRSPHAKNKESHACFINYWCGGVFFLLFSPHTYYESLYQFQS
jgi:hypothetical protein